MHLLISTWNLAFVKTNVERRKIMSIQEIPFAYTHTSYRNSLDYYNGTALSLRGQDAVLCNPSVI